MSAAPTLADIKALLQARVLALAMQLAPENGHRSGKWWIASNPTRIDRNPSFGVAIAGEAPGAWVDFATGDKGDILQLIQYTQSIPRADVRAALSWARAWLGLDGAAPPAIAKRVVQARAAASKREADLATLAEKNARRAKAIYLASKKPTFEGSPAARYLATRGINITALARKPGALGWLPDGWHSDTKTKWPIMVACFTNDRNEAVAIHRTFLARDGSGKAPVDPPRKIWPAFKGAAIRLARGASGLSIDDAAKQGVLDTLVLVEGVEDGLSVALAAPDFRVWAAGSLGNLAEITLPACVDQVIVCADNDWGKPQAQMMLNRALDALAKQGRTVRVARSTVGKDVNDALCL